MSRARFGTEGAVYRYCVQTGVTGKERGASKARLPILLTPNFRRCRILAQRQTLTQTLNCSIDVGFLNLGSLRGAMLRKSSRPDCQPRAPHRQAQPGQPGYPHQHCFVTLKNVRFKCQETDSPEEVEVGSAITAGKRGFDRNSHGWVLNLLSTGYIWTEA
jgi:hypothetical protein